MIQLIKPYLDYTRLEPELAKIINSGMLTKGEYSRLFPKLLADYVQADHVFLTTSATTALTMCLKLIGAGPGDEVVVSDFSFPASANVIEDVGATPVFADVNLATYNMAYEELQGKVTEKTKAVIYVDALGNPSGIKAVAEFCRARQIVLIEDAACAIGSMMDGQRIGSIADLTCFSFHPRKLLTCGEGGAIATNDLAYAEALSLKLNHGADAAGDFVTYGYNYRMPELACCLGCSLLDGLDAIIAERRAQAQRYTGLLDALGFVPQQSDPDAYHNMQSVVFVTPPDIRREALSDWLRTQDIETTLGTYSLSATTYYRQKYDDVQANSLYLQSNTISLPCYRDVPIDYVCERIAEYMTLSPSYKTYG